MLSLEKGNWIYCETRLPTSLRQHRWRVPCKLERASTTPSLRLAHSTEKEGGLALGLVSPVYDLCQHVGIGHWTYTCDDRAKGEGRERAAKRPEARSS